MSAGVVTAFGIQKHYAQKTPCRMEVDGFNDFIFTNRFGDVQHQGTLNKALRERIIRDCNAEAMAKNRPLLPRFSCHTLRHTFCTNLCAAGVDEKTISEILSHADLRVTLEIYAEVTKDMKTRAVKSLEDYLNEDD
ncbi:MAG: tyrosine-type recombinase/integrase [Clostridia bacterium]|nr:tyrosine-type recombinase/integrase [Clostridia bacterium]